MTASLGCRRPDFPAQNRSPDGGGVALWLMNGATVASALGVGSVTTDWQIQGNNSD